MGEIIEFPNSGYTYFAKAVLDHLCDGEENVEDFTIQVESISMGTCFPIMGAELDCTNRTINLLIK